MRPTLELGHSPEQEAWAGDGTAACASVGLCRRTPDRSKPDGGRESQGQTLSVGGLASSMAERKYLGGMASEFGYARPPDGAYIAYRVDGGGPIDIVWQPDWFANVDVTWQTRGRARGCASSPRSLALSRTILAASGCRAETSTCPHSNRVSDLLAVLRSTGTRRPVLAGQFVTGTVHLTGRDAARRAARNRVARAFRSIRVGPRLSLGRHRRGPRARSRVHRSVGNRCLCQDDRRRGGGRRKRGRCARTKRAHSDVEPGDLHARRGRTSVRHLVRDRCPRRP